MLTPGEFVVRKSSVDKYGSGMMKSINAGTFSGGGIVNYLSNGGLSGGLFNQQRPMSPISDRFPWLSDTPLSEGTLRIYQQGLDSIKSQRTILKNTVLGKIGYDDIISAIETAIVQEQRFKDDFKDIAYEFMNRASRAAVATGASEKGMTFSEGHHRTGQSNEQSFTDKYAGTIAFTERFFRPLTEAGTATFQGVTGGLSVGIGALGGGELYTQTGMERLNLAGQSAISAGTLGSVHEGAKKARERYDKFVRENYDSDLVTATKITDFVGEATAGVAPEAGIASGLGKVFGTGAKAASAASAASAATKGGAAAAKGGKSSRVIAATEELRKIDDVIAADTAYLKSLKKAVKQRGIGETEGARRIKNLESSIKSMKKSRQTRLGELDELKKIEQGTYARDITGTELAKTGDDLPRDITQAFSGVTKSDEVAKAAKVADVAVDAAKTGKVTALQRVGKVLKKTGGLGKRSLILLARAAIKAAGNKDALNLIDNFFRDDTVQKSSTRDYAKELADEEAKKAIEEASGTEKTKAPEDPIGPVNKPRPVDLVEYYSGLLGQGPKSDKVDPSKVDLDNPIVIRRLRSNEIAIARVAGAERGLGESRIKDYSSGGDPASVDLPYPDMEQVRRGKTVLSNIEREYYAYQGAFGKFLELQGISGSPGPFEYFKKHYNDILSKSDPLTLRLLEGNETNKFNRQALGQRQIDPMTGKPESIHVTRRRLREFHSGGMIPGRAETPLYAQGGEFVMQRSAVNRIGAGNLHYMNNGGNVPANGTMNVMGAESLNDAAGRIENALVNHALPEAISVILGGLDINLNGGNILPQLEKMITQTIAESLMDYENTKDTDNSPGSYGRSVAQERFGNTA